MDPATRMKAVVAGGAFLQLSVVLNTIWFAVSSYSSFHYALGSALAAYSLSLVQQLPPAHPGQVLTLRDRLLQLILLDNTQFIFFTLNVLLFGSYSLVYLVPLAIYAVLQLAVLCSPGGALVVMLPPDKRAPFLSASAPVVSKVRANQETLLAQAATFEFMSFFVALFAGTFAAAVSVYSFLLMRYQSSKYSQGMLNDVGSRLDGVVGGLPSFVNTAYAWLRNMLRRHSESARALLLAATRLRQSAAPAQG